MAVFKRNAGAVRYNVETDNQPYKDGIGRQKEVAKTSDQSTSIYSFTETDNHARVGVNNIADQCVKTGNQSTSSTDAGEGSCLHASNTVICRPNAGEGRLQSSKVQVHQNKVVSPGDTNNMAEVVVHNKVTMAGPGTKSKIDCEAFMSNTPVKT